MIVPVIETVEKVIDVPKVKQVEIPQIITVERLIEIPSTQTVERFEEIPIMHTFEGERREVDIPTRFQQTEEMEVVMVEEEGPIFPHVVLEPVVIGLDSQQQAGQYAMGGSISAQFVQGGSMG